MDKLQDKKVACFGEVMLRMAMPSGWASGDGIAMHIGGAELNVATALACWETPARYITALPDNYIGQQVLNHVAACGIENDAIKRTGSRTGLYYLVQGLDLKNNGVVYDREHSSFGELLPGDIDWNEALDGCNWFHFSAISPALSKNAALVCKEAVEAAAAKGLTISVDLNYRDKLWQYGQTPDTIMPGLVQHCHVIMGNIWSAEKLLGIPATLQSSEGISAAGLSEAALESAYTIKKQFPKAVTTAFTFRLPHSYWGVLEHADSSAVSSIHDISDVTNRVGSGDCFMGGLIYGLLNNFSAQNVIDFAAAAAVGKLSEPGDATKQTVSDIKRRMNHG